MDNIIIEEKSDGKIIINDENTNRHFELVPPKKFNYRFFGSLDPRSVILERLTNKNFAYYSDKTKLTISMTLNSGKKTYDFSIECEEVFPDEFIDLDISNLDTDVKRFILSLQTKINNLVGQVEEMKEELKYEKQKRIDDEYYKHLYS